MKAILLAAGFSTRLADFTQTKPKGLLEVHGTVILWQILSQILEQKEKGSIDEVVLVTNNLYYSIFVEWLKNEALSSDVEVINDGANVNDERLGAIGDINLVIEKKKWQDSVLVVASDTRSSFVLSEFIDFFNQHGSFSNAIFDTHNPEIIKNALGNLLLDNTERIVQFIEKPTEPISTITSIPYYIYSSQSLRLLNQYVSSGLPSDSPGAILPWLLDKIPVYGFMVEGYYQDIGTPESLSNAQ